jgi:hypothetical protein
MHWKRQQIIRGMTMHAQYFITEKTQRIDSRMNSGIE